MLRTGSNLFTLLRECKGIIRIIVYKESLWQCEVKWWTSVCCVSGSLWVIAVVSHCISYSKHLVVVFFFFMRTFGTTPVWNSYCICQRLGSSLESVGYLCGSVNGGWDESSVVHRTPTDYIRLFTLLIIDWTLLYWCTGRFIWVMLAY